MVIVLRKERSRRLQMKGLENLEVELPSPEMGNGVGEMEKKSRYLLWAC